MPLQKTLLDKKSSSMISLVLFCLDTKKNEKRSSTNTAPLRAASRLAATHARVGRAVRARPPCNSKMKFSTTLWNETRVRRRGKKAGVRRQVGEEHFFALSFLVLFSTKEKRTKKADQPLNCIRPKSFS